VAALAALGIVYAALAPLRRRDAACGLIRSCASWRRLHGRLAGPSLTRMLLNDTWLCLFAALIARRLFGTWPPCGAADRLGSARSHRPLVAGAPRRVFEHFLRAGKSEQAMQHFGATQTIMGMFVALPAAGRKVYVLHSLRVDSLRYLIATARMFP